jgi:hypothetical protein
LSLSKDVGDSGRRGRRAVGEDRDQSISLLEEKIDEFLSARDQVMSASRVIDPLLEIWALAVELNPSVAGPVERLLTALVTRELTTLDELTGAMDEVRAGLAAESARESLPSGA